MNIISQLLVYDKLLCTKVICVYVPSYVYVYVVQYNVVPSLFEGTVQRCTFVKVNLLSYESKYLLIKVGNLLCTYCTCNVVPRKYLRRYVYDYTCTRT